MAGERVLYTPAGKCPVKLDGYSFEEVRDWANLVIEKGRQSNLVYLPSALLYFSQQFYSIFTKEHKEIKSHIEQIFHFSAGEEKSFVENQKENIKKEQEQASIERKESENITSEKTKKKRGRPPKNKN